MVLLERARHKKVLKAAKGYYGARSRVYRVAFQAVIKAGQYAYRDRRQRKRQFRQLWIARIQRCGSSNGLSYSKFINGTLWHRAESKFSPSTLRSCSVNFRNTTTVNVVFTLPRMNA